MVGKDRIRNHATNLHWREGVKDKHDHIALAANPVGHINGSLGSHRIAVGGDVRDQQRIVACAQPDHRNASVCSGLKTGRYLQGINMDNDGVHILGHRIFNSADHGSHIASGVDCIDVPAFLAGALFKTLDQSLSPRLRQKRSNDGNVLRECVCAKRNHAGGSCK